jgi:hypothetical protein
MINLRNSSALHSLIVFILVVHAALWLLLYPTVEEDAFIYLRFAQNIADGWGYVFNIGGERIESGTSPVWLMLLVASIKLHVPPIFAMKALGLIFSLLTILITGRLTFVLTGATTASLFAMATLAVSYPLVYWADQGLETPLIAFLLSFILLCLVDSRWRQALSPACIALILARPEGVIYLSLVFGWGVWQRDLGDRAALLDVLRPMGLALFALLASTLWRIWYFGDFVAHPFYFKSSQINAASAFQLFAVANQRLRLDLLLAPLALALMLKKLPPGIWVLVTALILQTAWFVSVTDHFTYERHLVPVLPALHALFAVGGYYFACAFHPHYQRFIFLVLVGIPIFAIAQYQKNPLLEFPRFFLHRPVNNSKAIFQHIINPEAIQETGENSLDAFLQSKEGVYALGHNWEAGPGRFLAAAYPRGSVIASHEMGQTPYYAGSDKVFIDTVGLVTKQTGFYRFGTSFDDRPSARWLWGMRCKVLAKLTHNLCPSLEPQDTINYILDQHPDIVMVHSFIAAIYGERLPPQLLLRDASFQQLYRLRYTIDKCVQVYERKDRNFPEFVGNIPGVIIERRS